MKKSKTREQLNKKFDKFNKDWDKITNLAEDLADQYLQCDLYDLSDILEGEPKSLGKALNRLDRDVARVRKMAVNILSKVDALGFATPAIGKLAIEEYAALTKLGDKRKS